MWPNIRINPQKIALGSLLLLAFATRSSALMATIPKGSDPYLFGGAVVNLLNELSISAALPYGGVLTHIHLESLFFLLFLVPFKLLFSDMKVVLKIVPGVLGAINVLGIYLFTKALTKEEEVAVLSALLLAFNPFHSYTTKIATPEGLALGLLFLSMYLLLEDKILFAGMMGGLILLTDYLIFGHYLIILFVYSLTNLDKENLKDVATVLFLALIIAAPWQLYLNSLSTASTFSGNVGVAHAQKLLLLDPTVVADTLHFLPTAITPLHAFFVIGGLYMIRKKRHFKFLAINLILFLILSLANTGSLGAPPLRHLISLGVFSSVVSAEFLASVRIKKPLFVFLLILSVASYFAYPMDFYVEFPRETVNVAEWINMEVPHKSVLSAPSPAYAVFTGRTSIYENNPCGNREINYVVDDRNFERWPTSYKGKTLEILDHNCLELVYKTKNVEVFKVVR